jgi:hypothetical protein
MKRFLIAWNGCAGEPAAGLGLRGSFTTIGS